MITEQCIKTLDSTYLAKDTEESAKVYDAWSSKFEQEMGAMGYVNPALTPAIVERWAKNKDIKILDVGCATGLIGAYLHFIGFDNLHAVDHSTEMVKIAESKQVYKSVKNASLKPGAPLPYDNEEFDMVIPMGIFTIAHAPVEGVEELVRITKIGGHLVFSCTKPGWNEYGFGKKIELLESNGTWQRVDQTREYITIPGASPDRLYHSTIYVYKRLK